MLLGISVGLNDRREDYPACLTVRDYSVIDSTTCFSTFVGIFADGSPDFLWEVFTSHRTLPHEFVLRNRGFRGCNVL